MTRCEVRTIVIMRTKTLYKRREVYKRCAVNVACGLWLAVLAADFVYMLSLRRGAASGAGNKTGAGGRRGFFSREQNRLVTSQGVAEKDRGGVHGLRRSFASLAYHLRWSELETMRVGGWSDFQTMRKIYTKLAAQDESEAARKMERFYSGESENRS